MMKSISMRFTVITILFLINWSNSIKAQSIPAVDAGPLIKILHGGKAFFKPTVTGSGLSYKWTPSPGIENDQLLNAVATVPNTTYTLTVTSQDGYIAEDKVYVQEVELNIPDVFTPNGDGINDLFVVEGIDSYPGVVVRFYNRANALVYESTGYANPWNGRYFNTGALLDADGYLFQANIPGLGVRNKVISLIR